MGSLFYLKDVLVYKNKDKFAIVDENLIKLLTTLFFF